MKLPKVENVAGIMERKKYVVFNDECVKLSELSPALKIILLKSQNVGVICHIMESSKLSPIVVLLLKS